MKLLTLILTMIASQTIASAAQAASDVPASTESRPVTIQHVTVTSRRSFDTTLQAFEKQLGVFDPEPLKSVSEPAAKLEEIKAKLESMAGPSGFMRFGGIHKFGDLVALAGKPTGKANQYTIGNPLIALLMVKHNFGVGLYVPLRILISEDAGGVTHLEYDLPSSLLEQFKDPEVDKVAHMLDKKLSALIGSSAGL